MNLIPEIAKMLGVKIGEEFEVENDVCLHRFTENGLEYRVCGVWSACARLNLILNGTEKIIKLPFEPKDGEPVWVVNFYDESNVFTLRTIWHDTMIGYAIKQSGNCFRTEAEAEAHKFEIYEKLTGKKWKE